MRIHRYRLVLLSSLLVLLVLFLPNTVLPTTSATSPAAQPTTTPVASAYLPVVAKEVASSNPVVEKLYGLNFSPYTRPGQDARLGTPIDEDQIRELLGVVAPYTRWVRTFGVTNGLEKVPGIAHEYGLKVAVGVWLGDPETFATENERQIANGISIGQAGHADLLIVGSETLYRGDLTADQLIAYIARVKQAVPGVPVATADVYDRLLAHPAVIAAGDVVLPNHYPYWASVGVNEAIADFQQKYAWTVGAAGGKPVIISETGWPSAGTQHGAAIASPENARQYLLSFVSWARSQNVPYFYFEAFDEPAKSNYPGPEEAHFGIWYADVTVKPGMMDAFEPP